MHVLRVKVSAAFTLTLTRSFTCVRLRVVFEALFSILFQRWSGSIKVNQSHISKFWLPTNDVTLNASRHERVLKSSVSILLAIHPIKTLCLVEELPHHTLLANNLNRPSPRRTHISLIHERATMTQG
jgi:hypothetical protein